MRSNDEVEGDPTQRRGVDTDRVQGNPYNSLSGKERNHLFLSCRAEQFAEMSPLSGLDHEGDSRSFAVLDYDRDGWLDIALMNANAPKFQLFRNGIGALADAEAGNFVAVRLVGGAKGAKPSEGWSNRDGVGARVELEAGGLTLGRERALGRGLAAQNTATLLVGIGTSERADALRVRWPSGRTTDVGAVDAGTLVVVHEDPTDSPTGEAAVRSRYGASPIATPALEPSEPVRFLPSEVDRKGTEPGLRAYVAMATWCAACKRELAQVRTLVDTFDGSEVELYGLPIDVEEGRELLESYREEWTPAYELLLDLPVD